MSDHLKDQPDFVNEEGTKWWRHDFLSDYATRKGVHGVSMPATCFAAETKDGHKSFVLINSTDGPLYDCQALDAMACWIDAWKLSQS